MSLATSALLFDLQSAANELPFSLSVLFSLPSMFLQLHALFSIVLRHFYSTNQWEGIQTLLELVL